MNFDFGLSNQWLYWWSPIDQVHLWKYTKDLCKTTARLGNTKSVDRWQNGQSFIASLKDSFNQPVLIELRLQDIIHYNGNGGGWVKGRAITANENWIVWIMHHICNINSKHNSVTKAEIPFKVISFVEIWQTITTHLFILLQIDNASWTCSCNIQSFIYTIVSWDTSLLF